MYGVMKPVWEDFKFWAKTVVLALVILTGFFFLLQPKGPTGGVAVVFIPVSLALAAYLVTLWEEERVPERILKGVRQALDKIGRRRISKS